MKVYVNIFDTEQLRSGYN